MWKLDYLPPDEDLSGAWCDTSPVISSLMEAISFITPVLEKFFIRTVTEALAKQQDPDIALRCRAFVHEEAVHSYAHKRLNASLLNYLPSPPPGFAIIQSLLDEARQHLPLPQRLLLAATLEHFSAVLSKAYLSQASQWDFCCAFAKELFAQHAREELAHRSVVFDLWSLQGKAGRLGRSFIVSVVLLTGLVYSAVAVPWILHHKTGQSLGQTLSACTGFMRDKRLSFAAYPSLRELFLFTHPDYHPDSLLTQGLAADSQ